MFCFSLHCIRTLILKIEDFLNIIEGREDRLILSHSYISTIRQIEYLIHIASLKNQHKISYILSDHLRMNMATNYFASCGYIVSPNDAAGILEIIWMPERLK